MYYGCKIFTTLISLNIFELSSILSEVTVVYNLIVQKLQKKYTLGLQLKYLIRFSFELYCCKFDLNVKIFYEFKHHISGFLN